MGDDNETMAMMPHHGTTTGNGLNVHRRMLMHMSFFWGHKTVVLFKGWPGSSSGMYALALICLCPRRPSGVIRSLHRCQGGFFKTGMHAVRSGLSYMVILTVMSFDGGVFLPALGGHTVGYLLFGSRVFKKSGGSGSPKRSGRPPGQG